MVGLMSFYTRTCNDDFVGRIERVRIEREWDAKDFNSSRTLRFHHSTSAHARASQLLRNLGFTEELANRKMKQLSGGWRVRTSLAAALFATPDILFLDEPTNHLSIQAVMFLAKELVENPVWKSRIIVCVSHDRHFLTKPRQIRYTFQASPNESLRI